LTAREHQISVEFRALGGAMQDAPLAQLFVRWFVGQLSVSGLTYFFRTRAVRREMLSCEPPQADRPFAGA